MEFLNLFLNIFYIKEYVSFRNFKAYASLNISFLSTPIFLYIECSEESMYARKYIILLKEKLKLQFSGASLHLWKKWINSKINILTPFNFLSIFGPFLSTCNRTGTGDGHIPIVCVIHLCISLPILYRIYMTHIIINNLIYLKNLLWIYLNKNLLMFNMLIVYM